MKLDESFTVLGALLPKDGQWLVSGGDIAFCNKLHINNFIILLSAEKKRMGRQAESNLLSPLQRTVESLIQTDHRGFASMSSMRPIHPGKIASELQRQAAKSVLMQPAAPTRKQRASESAFFHIIHSERWGWSGVLQSQ